MITYRLADEKDTDRLAELRWEFRDGESPLDPAGKEAFLRTCSDFLKGAFDKEYTCWVAVENEIIISHIYVVAVPKVPKPDKLDGIWGYVTAVYTVPEHRNKGIGSALMEKAKEWSRAQGLEHLIVWPSERSIPFYERAGFNGVNDVLELPL